MIATILCIVLIPFVGFMMSLANSSSSAIGSYTFRKLWRFLFCNDKLPVCFIQIGVKELSSKVGLKRRHITIKRIPQIQLSTCQVIFAIKSGKYYFGNLFCCWIICSTQRLLRLQSEDTVIMLGDLCFDWNPRNWLFWVKPSMVLDVAILNCFQVLHKYYLLLIYYL